MVMWTRNRASRRAASVQARAAAWHRIAAVLLTTLTIAVQAAAQATNPNIVMFMPSAHHDTIGRGNVPLVTGYQLELYPRGSSRPALVLDLGKPAAGADGYIRVDVGARLADSRLTNAALEARVTVVGPEGASQSAASNVVTLDGCRYLVPSSVSVAVSGGEVSIPVATGAACEWQLSASSSWLAPTPESSGAGTGRMTVTAAGNPTSQPRLGFLAVGPQLVLILQEGPSSAPNPR
jgi:hypothetical protein